MSIHKQMRALEATMDSMVDQLKELALRVSKLEEADAYGTPQKAKAAESKASPQREKNSIEISKDSSQMRASQEEKKQKRSRPRRKKQKAIPDDLKKVARTPEGIQGFTSLSKIFEEMQAKEEQQAEEQRRIDSSLTEVIALDCEMVGVGPRGIHDMLARVSVVNLHGNVVYDEYVRPEKPITNYRTKVSGIRPEHLKDGKEFSMVRKEMAAILKNRIVVGHSVYHDFKVLSLFHPKKLTRDTSYYKTYRGMFDGKTPALKNLAHRVLNLSIQEGEHSSVEDAQVAMKLYLHQRREWENELRRNG